MVDTTPDFSLVRSFLGGDISAFNVLAARYQQKIYWHARRMSGSHLDADDIMQEVLMTMFEKFHTFKFNSSVYTWIYKITATRSINFLKRKKIKSFFSFDDVQSENLRANDNVADQYEIKEKMEKLDAVLQKLPDRQREVFLLRNFESLGYDEISEITGVSVGSLKASYFHALEKINKWM